MHIARAALHFGEEPCISGSRGSGTVFFSGCNLGCVFCQNAAISRNGRLGRAVTPKELRAVFEDLISQGAHNINLVTPTHFVPLLKQALSPRLPVPVIYNCGGYESPQTLRLLRGLVDIYLPDYKYSIPALAARYSAAPDYPEVCRSALAEMYRQVGDARFSSDGLMTGGVLVRHLILPGALLNTKGVLLSLNRLCRDRRILLSLMAQYTPMPQIQETFPELSRPVSQRELHSVRLFLQRLSHLEGYCQSPQSVGTQYIPPFEL